MNERELERFWEKVDRSGGPDACWPWLGGANRGYGHFWLRGKTRKAHRIAYEITNGPMPDGMDACHHCDNPPCCNARHLFAASGRDNTADKVRKRRHAVGERTRPETRARGERQHLARLTDEVVEEIRALANRGDSWTEIGRRYGVHRTTAQRAVTGTTWAHVARRHRDGWLAYGDELMESCP